MSHLDRYVQHPTFLHTYQSSADLCFNKCIWEFGLEHAQIRLQPRETIWWRQSKLIHFIFLFKGKCKTKHIMILMDGRSIVKYVLFWYALPDGRRCKREIERGGIQMLFISNYLNHDE